MFYSGESQENQVYVSIYRVRQYLQSINTESKQYNRNKRNKINPFLRQQKLRHQPPFDDYFVNYQILQFLRNEIAIITQGTFLIFYSEPLAQDVFIQLVKQHETLVELDPNYFTISASNPQNRTVSVRGLQLGHLDVTATSVPDESWMYVLCATL